MVPEAPEPLLEEAGIEPILPLPRHPSRVRAIVEVVLCSGYPTQLLTIGGLSAIGLRPGTADALSPAFVFALSGIDTVVLLSLIFWFLKQSGEHPRELFMGSRPVAGEISLGIFAVPALFMLVVLVQIALRVVAPYLHNVPVSPFTPFLGSASQAAALIVLVVVAGGVREEFQRAFLLHRFEQRLGGGTIGLVITSVAFGLGHTVQGWDAAIATSALGAFWGAVYLTRRSIVATVTSHALFNVAQVLVGYATLARA